MPLKRHVQIKINLAIKETSEEISDKEARAEHETTKQYLFSCNDLLTFNSSFF